MTSDTERRNRPALELYVPEPHARPGDEVDFSHIEVPPAGSVSLPDIAVSPDAIRIWDCTRSSTR